VTDEADRGTTLLTVERAFRVLELVAASSTPFTVRDIADTLGKNVSTTYNLVNTLLLLGYLTKEGAGELRVGPKVAILHAAFVRGSDFARILRPYAEDLALQSGETAYITRLIRDRVVIQAAVESRQSLRVSGLEVGYSGSEDRRASGRAVLAFMPAPERRAILERTLAGFPDAERAVRIAAMSRQVETIRARGYALDMEEYEVGVCCISAPYFDASSDVAGSATVSTPAVRASLLEGPIRRQVLRTAAAISAALHAPDVGSGKPG
jgi:DNA-binding IclR family transcriptional regulator